MIFSCRYPKGQHPTSLIFVDYLFGFIFSEAIFSGQVLTKDSVTVSVDAVVYYRYKKTNLYVCTISLNFIFSLSCHLPNEQSVQKALNGMDNKDNKEENVTTQQ